MRVTYQYKLYRARRNQHQHALIDRCGRAYNHCIALHRRYYRLTGHTLPAARLMRHLTVLKRTPRFGWLRDIPSQALQDVAQRIERAYRLFFRNRKRGIRSAPPGFKKVCRYKSYTLKQAGWALLGDNRIRLGEQVYRCFRDRLPPEEARLKTATVKRDALGDLYVYLVLEHPDPISSEAMSGEMAGFDFGLTTFLTVHDDSAAYAIPSPEFFRHGLNAVRRANRHLSHKQPGSQHHQQAKRALAKVHRDIARRRQDWFFKLAHDLTDRYDVLCFETLNLRGMKRLWGRKVSDLGFATFLDILRHVAAQKGKQVVFVDRFYPSSQLCSQCGYRHQHLELSQRRWRCPHCQTVVDRDPNAALNILREGASSLGGANVRPGVPGSWC